MSPQHVGGNIMCEECRQCIFYWAASCPGLDRYSREACARIS